IGAVLWEVWVDIWDIIGKLQNSLGQPAEALRAYDRAGVYRDSLSRQYPGDRAFRSELARTCHYLGETHARVGNREEARRQFQFAIDADRASLVGPGPADQYRARLGNHYAALARLYREWGREKEMAEAARQLVEFLPCNGGEAGY